MTTVFPLQLLDATFAGWVTLHQAQAIEYLIEENRVLKEQLSWGYCRIRGELKTVSYRVAPSTIAKTLKEHGIAPSPQRHRSWRTLLKAHADVLAATGFFSVEVWTAQGLITH